MIGIEALPSRQRRSLLNTANKPLYQPDPIDVPRNRAHAPRDTKRKKRYPPPCGLLGVFSQLPLTGGLVCAFFFAVSAGAESGGLMGGVTIIVGVVYRGASTVNYHEAFPTSPSGIALCWLLHGTGSWAGNLWAPQAAQGKP